MIALNLYVVWNIEEIFTDFRSSYKSAGSNLFFIDRVDFDNIVVLCTN